MKVKIRIRLTPWWRQSAQSPATTRVVKVRKPRPERVQPAGWPFRRASAREEPGVRLRQLFQSGHAPWARCADGCPQSFAGTGRAAGCERASGWSIKVRARAANVRGPQSGCPHIHRAEAISILGDWPGPKPESGFSPSAARTPSCPHQALC